VTDKLVEAATATVASLHEPAEDRWMTRPEVAARWNMPRSTLDQWAAQRKGPRYALFGRHARYLLSDVIAWETSQFAQGLEGAE
jgi:predicted DNA-binding transcriptional regulator AlpA